MEAIFQSASPVAVKILWSVASFPNNIEFSMIFICVI